MMKMHVGVIVPLLVLLCAAPGTQGFHSGAPERACYNMSPLHGGRALETPPPYELIIEQKNRTTYAPGERIEVKLVGREDATFRGFLLQARTLSAEFSKPIGQWTHSRKMKDICSKRGLTHRNARAKERIKATWIAPDVEVGDIVFRATVVQSFKVFWEDVDSRVLHEASSVTTPAPTFTPAPNATCVEQNLMALPEQRPNVAILCGEDLHCPCGWFCCPLCEEEHCAQYAICRQPQPQPQISQTGDDTPVN